MNSPNTCPISIEHTYPPIYPSQTCIPTCTGQPNTPNLILTLAEFNLHGTSLFFPLLLFELQLKKRPISVYMACPTLNLYIIEILKGLSRTPCLNKELIHGLVEMEHSIGNLNPTSKRDLHVGLWAGLQLLHYWNFGISHNLRVNLMLFYDLIYAY